MSFPVAGGFPTTYSGKEIPQWFSKKMLVKYYPKTLLGQITNRNWEGEIKDSGDEVKIRSQTDVDIVDYVMGQTIDYQRYEHAQQSLLIDKGKMWRIEMNDVLSKQSDLPLANKQVEDASRNMATTLDTDLLANVYADVHASNTGATAGLLSADINLGVSGTPLQFTATNAIDTIVNCGVVLDEQNVPQEGRWIVLPAWAVGMIKKSDIKDASMMGDSKSALRTGLVGMIDTFMIFKSNLIATATDGATVWNCIFGTNDAITFASQLVKSRQIEDKDDFATYYSGLNVYGYKVVKPEAIGRLYIKK